MNSALIKVQPVLDSDFHIEVFCPKRIAYDDMSSLSRSERKTTSSKKSRKTTCKAFKNVDCQTDSIYEEGSKVFLSLIRRIR